MENSFKKVIQNRRTIYSIKGSSPITDENIEEILKFALLNVPSAFNSQSTRIVLLLGEKHLELWNIIKEGLRKKISTDKFSSTEKKIDSFAKGYGTILYFEDNETIKGLQEQFSLYADKFKTWSEHTSAMHQYTIWCMLEDAGFGASLQHYNPIFDKEIKSAFNINDNWNLIAQMPFGKPTAPPTEKQFNPINERLLVIK